LLKKGKYLLLLAPKVTHSEAVQGIPLYLTEALPGKWHAAQPQKNVEINKRLKKIVRCFK